MGYRSEVAFNITGFNSDVEAKEFLDEVFNTFSEMITNFDIDEIKELIKEIKIERNSIRYHSDYVTWYEEYMGVKFSRHLMLISEEYDHLSWAFARVGEETGDIETDYSGDEPQYIYTIQKLDEDTL